MPPLPRSPSSPASPRQRIARAALSAIAALVLAAPGSALDAPSGTALGPTALLANAALDPTLPLTPQLAADLATRKHAAAADGLAAMPSAQLSGRAAADRAFLRAWTLLRADKGDQAVPLLSAVQAAEDVPDAYRWLTAGELLLHDDQHVAAAELLAQVPPDAVIPARAQLALADARFEAGATAEGLAVYEALAARPDPAEGSDVALGVLAQRAGTGSQAAYRYLRRLWAHYPRTADGLQAARTLASYETKGSKYRPTPAEIAFRADALMESWRFQDATDLVAAHAGSFDTPDAAACMAWYAWGRSHFKRNNVTLAAEILVPAGEQCAGIDDDRGAKSLYVAGKALERKKAWSQAAAAFRQIPVLYPDHSMADDGYALAGVGLQIAGDSPAAIALWTAQVDEHPDGDLAAEGFWRLAWSAYLDGDTEAAIRWAERCIWQVPLSADPSHVLACHYWAARWRLYPDVSAPDTLTGDADDLARGIDLLVELCRNHPTSFYALLGAQRLYELAPDRLAGVERPPWATDPATTAWTVRTAWLDLPAVQRGLALSRLGLVQEALAELGTVDDDVLTPSEFAVVAAVKEHADPIRAHDMLHHYLSHHPPSTLGVDTRRILESAYPDLYWDEVQSAADGYLYDPRLFHGLVREESSFNKDIVSWAGARGLSQLMPATARSTAGWMGLKVSTSQLNDPELNLKIGARYLQSLAETYDGNMFLAIPGYNAGPGNVNKWLRAQGSGPTDELVESITIRETRHYVKRVMGTWQLYRVLYDPDPTFADLSAFNHLAQP